MNNQNSDDIWTDDPDATPLPSPTGSFISTSTSSAPSFHPPQFDPNTPLTAQQKKLLKIYHLHRHFEIEVMNTIVDLDIDIQRERDEPGVKFLRKELEEMQEELVMHREGKRRMEGKIRREKDRLKRIVEKRKGQDKDKDLAKRQLEEMEKVMEKRMQKVKCLR